MTTFLGWLLFVLAAFFTKTAFGGENCDDPDRLVVCHIETKLHPSTDPCACTHLVIHNPHDSELLQEAVRLREKNRRLKILSLAEEGKKHLLDDGVSGVYLKLSKTLSKEQVVKNVKTLATELDNFQASKRANAKYSSESTTDGSKDIAEILLELPSAPEQLAKNYDLKSLNKYINYFIITSDNLTDSSEEGLAYHPSRLMGIDDILNADSLVDLISGLGAEHEKLLISLPATALKFNLKDPKDNMPRAKVTAPPETISRKELCSLIENGVWTLERDEDLTAPYAYSDTTWLAFDDSVSAAIKAKYILLRGLAGISVTKSEADDWGHACASRPILDTIYGTFTNLVRKPRAAALLSLQDQIHNSFTPFAGDVQLSPFRIVRVVDRAGSIHVVRKEAKTEFQCSRQGYFTHPSGCNRFYRCVKFNQFSSDFTVFEYDCPAGLAFDERYEVCVWPGSLPDASACKGSSEIAPVPRSRFACPTIGYFADPENCRWFFACYDHHGDGRSPTAYEFRCPFGLVFNEKTLTCDWPWSVSGCGSGSVIDSSSIYPGDILEGRLRPTYAQVSDLHVSGGRIADVNGGLVLGTNLLSGISASGQRYSNGYSLGLANQINSAFGGSQYEGNSGAYIHDPSGDIGGEYIHEEGPYGPDSSYLSGKGSYVGSSGRITSENNGQYIHDLRENTGQHIGGVSGTTSYTSLGSSDENFSSGRVPILGAGSSGIDTSGSYVHDSRGDTGGAYAHEEGPQGPGSKPYLYSGSSGVITGNTGTVSVSGQSNANAHDSRGYAENSGSYVHDSRGDTGVAYVHEEGPQGPGSKPYLHSGSAGVITGNAGIVSVSGQSDVYAHDFRGDSRGQYVHTEGLSGTSSHIASSGGHYSEGGISLHAAGSSEFDNSGAYVHDSSGDTGGAYIHQERPSGPSSKPYLYSGSSTVVSGNAGTISVAGQPTAFTHDSRGETGNQYTHQTETVGHGSVIYSGNKIVNALTSGDYVHDSRGDTGGAYIHQQGPSGPGPVSYVHLEKAYKDSSFSGGLGYKTGQDYIRGHDLGGFIGSSYGSSTSGQYIHDSIGDTGGEYIHQEGPYHNKIYAGRYLGHYIHDNSGAYVHDTSGDNSKPYTHQEGPSGPSGPIYQDINVNNVYHNQYAGQYASKFAADHLKLSNYGTINTVGAHLYQPQAGVVHTYDISKLYVQPFGHKESVIKPNQNTINTVKLSGISLNPVQYLSPVSSIHPVSVTTPSPSILTEIKSQNIQPVTVAKLPTIPYNRVQYVSPTIGPLSVSGIKPHVQPVQFSTPSPVIPYETPVIRTQTSKPIIHSEKISLNYPEQVVVSTPATPVSYHEFQPVIKTGTVRPVTVTSVPVIPFNSVQYGQKTVVNTGFSGYGYSKPKLTFNYPQHILENQLIEKSKPISPVISYSYHPSVPLPAVKTVISQPVTKTNVVTPVVSSVTRPELISYHNPVIDTQTARPITVASTPVVPLNPVQYGANIQTIGFSTPAPPLIASHSYNPAIKTQTEHPVIISSTPTVPLSPIQYGVKTVSSSVGYHYSKPIVEFSYPKDTVYSTQGPPVISYTYQKPLVKTQPIQPIALSTPTLPGVSYTYKTQDVPVIVNRPSSPIAINLHEIPLHNVPISTPAPPVVSYSYQQPIKPFVPVAVSTPAPPVVSYSYQQPINPVVPVSYSTPAPPVVSYSVKTKPIQPIIVSSTPAVPYNPVRYVNPFSISTPAPPLVSYSYKQPVKPFVPVAVSTPAPPVVSYSYQQPIKPVVPVSYSTPAPPVVSYSVKTKPIQPIFVSSTPAVPLSPVQYINPVSISTPAPPLVSYSYKQPIKPVVPFAINTPAPPVVSYSYQQPIKPVVPVSYSKPAPPVVSYSVKTKPIQPIIVSSTPAVPLSPVQYVNPVSISTPAPPLVSYSYKQPVKPFVPVAVSTSAPPVVSYSYQQPIKPVVPVSYSTPAPPVVSYSVKTKPIQPIIVSSTPAVPYNPVRYVNPIAISTPSPPLVSYSYKQPVKPFVPVAVSTPAPPVVSYSYQRPVKPFVPVAVSTPAPPVVSYSYQQPINPVVPVSYSTPAPPVVSFSYKQPVIPISSSTPVPPVIKYSYQQPIKSVPFSSSTPVPPEITYSINTKPLQHITFSSTPVVPLNPVQYVKPSPPTPIVSYPYKKPISPVSPVFFSSQSPFINYSFKTKPVQPLTYSSTPVVPLNPIQYGKPVTTTALPFNVYSYKQPLAPIAVSTPSPPVRYPQPAPFKPVTPVAVSTPATPAISYTYKVNPVQPITITSTPKVPFNRVQYVKPVTVITSAPPVVDYSYQKLYESHAVNKAPNVVFSYSFEAKPISTSDLHLTPLNPVQYSVKPAPAIPYQPVSVYSTTSVPSVNYSYRRPTVKPITLTNQPLHPGIVTTPVPKVSYSYQEEPDYFVKIKSVRPVTVTSTPVVPFNPVQYISTTPRPVIYKYQNPVVKTHTSIVAPSAIDYYNEDVLHTDIVKVPPKPIVSSFYEVPTRTTTIAPITVTSTPIVPLNPVQYVKQSLPVFGYKYDHPQTATYNVKGCCSSPSLKVSTIKPDLLKTTLTSSTIISPRKPVVGAYFEENYEANRDEGGYIYSKPSIKFEEKPFIKQGIYSTPSPFAIPAEVTTSTYLQRPVQTYANTVEEESYISNTPEHVTTVVKQPISVDTSDENLNLHLDIPKIGINRPVYTTTTTPQQQIVEVTTVTPVVKKVKLTGGLTRGGYYVRRQKVKVQPVITTTENYPAYFTSTIKPVYSSNIDLTSPTLYSTTVRPSTIYTTSSTTTLKDDELEIEDEDDARLLEQVSGQFGEIINIGNQGIIRQGVSSTTVSSLKDGEAIVGVVKKEMIDGGSKKTKVVVVSKLSDFNPLLVGKLGAECSCKSNSKTLNLQRDSSRTRGQLFYPKVQNVPILSRGYLPSSAEPPNVKNYYLPTSQVPFSDAITSTTTAPAGYEYEPFVEIKPINDIKRLYTTTGSPVDATSPEYITTESGVIRNQFGTNSEKTSSEGASFDRYGPGGLRGADETLQGSIDCQRAGLFRHPKYCNKFYACNWDQWKKRFTLHVFNCPIHLAYDSQLGACNWPSKGPACADGNLLV